MVVRHDGLNIVSVCACRVLLSPSGPPGSLLGNLQLIVNEVFIIFDHLVFVEVPVELALMVECCPLSPVLAQLLVIALLDISVALGLGLRMPPFETACSLLETLR